MMKIGFGFVLAIAFLQYSCSSKTSKIVDNKVVSESVTDFKPFWKQFKSNVLSKNKNEVVEMVAFPFIDGFNDIYDVANSLTCNKKDEFVVKYDLIFDSYTLKAIETNSFRSYNKSYKENGDIIGKEDFLLITNNPTRSKDLVFKKINNKYYLIGIQYYQ